MTVETETPISVFSPALSNQVGWAPGLILEKLQATWLGKDAAIHEDTDEDTVLCSLHVLFSIFVCQKDWCHQNGQ